MKNPFVTNGYAGAEYFCDRVKETATLRDLLVNENNVALISPRRLGKTDDAERFGRIAENAKKAYRFAQTKDGVITSEESASLETFIRTITGRKA